QPYLSAIGVGLPIVARRRRFAPRFQPPLRHSPRKGEHVRSAAVCCVVRVAAVGALPPAARAQGPAAPKVTGYVQTRFEAIADSVLFKLRRARLGVQGGLTPWASYKLQGELRSG